MTTTTNNFVLSHGMTYDRYLKYHDYADRLGQLIYEDRPNLLGCVFVIMDKEEMEALQPYEAELNGLVEDEWYVKLCCENGHRYWINVTGENMLSMAESVLKVAVRK